MGQAAESPLQSNSPESSCNVFPAPFAAVRVSMGPTPIKKALLSSCWTDGHRKVGGKRHYEGEYGVWDARKNRMVATPSLPPRFVRTLLRPSTVASTGHGGLPSDRRPCSSLSATTGLPAKRPPSRSSDQLRLADLPRNATASSGFRSVSDTVTPKEKNWIRSSPLTCGGFPAWAPPPPGEVPASTPTMLDSRALSRHRHHPRKRGNFD